MRAHEAAVLLRIYTEEGKTENGRPLHEAIVMKARDLGVAGATVLRGPMSFGHSHAIRTAKLTDLAARLPLVIEIVDSEEKIQSLLDAFETMRDIGLVTRETVHVVHYSGAPSEP
jgi:PII-like signaling protein